MDHRTIVRTLFQVLLGREPDPIGEDHYNGLLERGSSPLEVAFDLMGSREFDNRQGQENEPNGPPLNHRTVIRALFHALLGRQPDLASTNHYVALLEDGLTPLALAFDLMGSREFVERQDRDENLPWQVLDDRTNIRALFRTLLGREPDRTGLAHYVSLLSGELTPLDVIIDLMGSQEFIDRQNRSGNFARRPIDHRTLVRAFFLGLLEREPETASLDGYAQQLDDESLSAREIALGILSSPEFCERQSLAGGGEFLAPTDTRLYRGYSSSDLALFEQFARPGLRGEPGFITDFVGSRVRTSSLWDACRPFDGRVFGAPVVGDYFADTVEWIGMLKAVQAADKSSFSMMEWGAGHGPWTTASAAAARNRGILSLHLVAIEADPGRYALLERNIADNHLTAETRLIRAAVGVKTGRVRWPRIADPRNHGGARPLRKGNEEDTTYLGEMANDTIEVEVLAASYLLHTRPLWDLVHVDVQGTEVELCAGCLDVLSERVRYLVIGTHSRKLDGDMIGLLGAAGWHLEHEKPTQMTCRSAPIPPSVLPRLTVSDGTQVWRNPRV